MSRTNVVWRKLNELNNERKWEGANLPNIVEVREGPESQLDAQGEEALLAEGSELAQEAQDLGARAGEVRGPFAGRGLRLARHAAEEDVGVLRGGGELLGRLDARDEPEQRVVHERELRERGVLEREVLGAQRQRRVRAALARVQGLLQHTLVLLEQQLLLALVLQPK